MYQQTTLDKSPLDYDTTHQIYFQDSRKMNQVDDSTVDLVITSPPYWKIKDYGNPNQIGFRDSLNGYFKKLDKVWSECIRVLHPGCRLCINIGDQYLRATKDIPYQIIPLHATLVNKISAKHKEDVLYLGSIIWQKVSTVNPTGGASVMGSYPYPRNGYLTYFNEYIAIFKKKVKEGEEPKPNPDPVTKKDARIPLDRWREYFNGIWSFKGEPQEGGIAVFPEELPFRLMTMFSYAGDKVLDPFLGSGTTTRVALDNHRNSIGYEIGWKAPDIEDFKKVIMQKIRYDEMSPEVRRGVFPTLTDEEETPHRIRGTQ